MGQRGRLIVVLVVLAFSCWTPIAAVSQDGVIGAVNVDDDRSRELDDLRARVAALESAGRACDGCVHGSGRRGDGCDDEPASCGGTVCPGLVGGAEIGFLRPFFSDGHDAGSAFDYEATPRFWLGYVTAGGLGIRARYWDFDHRGVSDPEGGGYRLDTSVLDLEAIDTIALGSRWDLAVSAGWRHVEFEFLNGEAPNIEGTRNSSNGLTTALELRRTLPRGLALFGGARWSWLYGDVCYRAPWLETGRIDWEGATQWMAETQLGAEWTRRLASGRASLEARAGVEAQWWDGFTGAMDAPQFGLFGYFVTVGISR